MLKLISRIIYICAFTTQIGLFASVEYSTVLIDKIEQSLLSSDKQQIYFKLKTTQSHVLHDGRKSTVVQDATGRLQVSGIKYAIKFREDSNNRFRYSEWWNGKNYFLLEYSMPRQFELMDYSPKITTQFIRNNLDFGHATMIYDLRNMLGIGPITINETQNTIEIENRIVNFRTYKVALLKLEDKLLVLSHFRITDAVGKDIFYHENIFKSPPRNADEVWANWVGIKDVSPIGEEGINLNEYEVRAKRIQHEATNSEFIPTLDVDCFVMDSRASVKNSYKLHELSAILQDHHEFLLTPEASAASNQDSTAREK